MKIYTTAADYIAENITPGLGDIDLTAEQAGDIAAAMLSWHTETDDNGTILLNHSGFIERDDVNFWDVVTQVCDEA